jgi:hypothetical protein
MSTISLYSTNYSGVSADITFTASTGGTFNLGLNTLPFEFTTEYPYGTYDLFFSAYNKTCTVEIPEPTPSPTPTNTPTTTINLSPTPTLTETPTNTPTLTETPTNTPTISVTPSITPSQDVPPFTGYAFNLVSSPYSPPTAGNILFTDFSSGGSSGLTSPNTFVNNGVYWDYVDAFGVNRQSFFTGLTNGDYLISFTSEGDSSIYSGNSNSFIFDDANTDVLYNPFLEPNNLVLVQSSSNNFVIGSQVQINFTGI